MKGFIIRIIQTILIIWLGQGNACGQEGPLKFIKDFFEGFPPCVESFYCYEYGFDVDKDNLIITTKLFNYKGDPKQKLLTEETKYLIPVDKIESINYFPNGNEDVYITTFGNNIKRLRKNQVERVKLIPLDFNKYKLTTELKTAFEKNFDLILDSFE